VTLAIVIGIAGLSVAIVTAIIEGLVAGGTASSDAIEGVWRVAAIGSAALGVGLGVLGSIARPPLPTAIPPRPGPTLDRLPR
jgi:hypothetical protein